jgi:hypothetical protein
MALHNMGKFDEAIEQYEMGIQYNPDNTQLKQGLESCKKDKEEDGMGGDGGMGGGDMSGMFGPQAIQKLMSNPKTAAYMMDPGFKSMFEMCKKNPNMMF